MVAMAIRTTVSTTPFFMIILPSGEGLLSAHSLKVLLLSRVVQSCLENG